MYLGLTVFAQVIDALPLRQFHTCVKRYDGNYRVFYGTSINAAKAQVWIAITTYLLGAILK